MTHSANAELARREELAELYVLGLPLGLIAERFHLTKSAAYYRAHRLGARQIGAGLVKRRRLMRLDRIRANIAASPSISMFDWGQP